MKVELLRDSVEVLKALRSELHGSVEDSVIFELDRVIYDLETALEIGSPILTAADVLAVLGMALEHLPSIIALVEQMIHVINKR